MLYWQNLIKIIFTFFEYLRSIVASIDQLRFMKLNLLHSYIFVANRESKISSTMSAWAQARK